MHSPLTHTHTHTLPGPYLDDLPQQAQDEMGFGIHDILWPDVDDVAADGGG